MYSNRRAFSGLNEAFKLDEVEGLVNDLTSTFENVNSIVTAVGDLADTWLQILGCIGIALVLSIIWILLLRFFAGVFIFLVILLCCAALGLFTYFTWLQKEDMKGLAYTAEVYSFGIYTQDLNRKVFTYLYKFSIALDVIFVLLILFLYDRIRLSIGILKIVSKIFGSVLSIFFLPLIIFILLLIWWVYVIGVSVVLFGAGYPTSDYSKEAEAYVVTYEYDKAIVYMSIYHFVGFLWVTNFIFSFIRNGCSRCCCNLLFHSRTKI